LGCGLISYSQILGSRMIGLVDCNNFYASCERLFRPELEGKPIVVLSNNDGCIVARSNEVKQMNIPMGTPFYKAKSFIQQHHINVFSSNYQLYGSLSARVMRVIEGMCPAIDIYSIDEAFIFPSHQQQGELTLFGEQVRQRVFSWVGIPVSVGFAKTKTLAKIANRMAKKTNNGVFVIEDRNKNQVLRALPIVEVWGVGRQTAKKLQAIGIHTGLDLLQANDMRLRKQVGVNGVRTAMELRGIHAILEDPVHAKSVGSSKSFSKPVSELTELKEALSCYVTTAYRKLRLKKLRASGLSVYIQTNHHNRQQPNYANLSAAQLDDSSNLGDVIKVALQLLEKIYRKGFSFIKVGVMFSDLSKGPSQPSLFNQPDSVAKIKSDSLQLVLDKIESNYGKDMLFYGVQGVERKWSMRQQFLSPCYTTAWSDILKIELS